MEIPIDWPAQIGKDLIAAASCGDGDSMVARDISHNFGVTPKKNKICPICNQKLGFTSNKVTCKYCGTAYHEECLARAAISISGKSAILLYPNQHDRIINRAKQARIDKLSIRDTRQFNENRDKVMMMPDNEALAEYKEKLCPQCAVEVRKIAPHVAKNLETAQRFDDAAMVFDDLGMYEDAGRMRGILSKPQSPVERERVEKEKIVERQIVKIKCRYCGALNDDIRRTCESCGANL